MRVSDELNALLRDQSATKLYASAKKLQRAYRTHVFRTRVGDSIKGYEGMLVCTIVPLLPSFLFHPRYLFYTVAHCQGDGDLVYVRKRNHTFKVMLAKEQEFLEHVTILRTKYQVRVYLLAFGWWRDTFNSWGLTLDGRPLVVVLIRMFCFDNVSQVPLQSIAMVDSKMRRSYFQPEDHARIFAGIDAVEQCSKSIIKRMNEGIKQQPR